MTQVNRIPTIAVVIPNRNDSSYLRACLDSVLLQAVRPDQILFVDDQSTDNSVELAHQILDDVPGAQIIINKTCLGTMGALNEGLSRVKSDYVLFLSSNDYLANGIFGRAKNSIATIGSPGVWSAMVWMTDENGHCRRSIYPSSVIALKDTFFDKNECIRLAMLLGNWFTGTTLIYHRETLQKIGGFDTEYQGLADLFAALTIASIKGALFCPEPLGVVRLHQGGYLWRTLSDWDYLEVILAKIMVKGNGQSPNLFSHKFCERTKHRVRFAAIRAFQGDRWPSKSVRWTGARYELLKAAYPFLGTKKIRTIVAFIIIRPFDVFSMIWYRVIKLLWVKVDNALARNVRHEE